MEEIKASLHELKLDLKEVKQDIKGLSKTLDRNTNSLIIHEARTTLAEKRIERFENASKWILGIIASGVVTVAARLLSK